MPSLHILSILHEYCDAAPPEAQVIREWKKRYLRIYDEQIDALMPQLGYKEERRKVIESTFDTLEEQARNFWRE